ncbi:MAG: gluconokinase [Morganella sp. (in: enterobacteria)]|uniref:Gluconokinase n=1 Tax=Morganella psychrotolerans TaxID=368603 RepID=A0A1B8HNC0_9GAMM|nr:gluconokinase [Morganella psychrotolerans]OBU10878.1 gluconate kinase [Morganella psychrotolerans]
MSDSQKPHHAFVLMGVSGCGKSAVANGIATGLNAAFLDGDYLHPRANIEKMADGHPLNDDDRGPWLQSLNDAIFAMQRTNELSVIVCSALKKSYRDILRHQNKNLTFIWLKGDFDLIESRLKARRGHFFKPEMLVTQFDTLEAPDITIERDVQILDISPPLDAVITGAMQIITQVAGERT